MAEVDPNWLLSTTAQSAAALVAIVSGFLISRLVTLSTEVHGLGARLRELEGLQYLADARRATVHDERLTWCEDEFVGHWTREAQSTRAFRTRDEYLEWQPIGTRDGELDVLAEEMAVTAHAARAILYDVVVGFSTSVSSETLRGFGLDFPDQLREFTEAIFRDEQEAERDRVQRQSPIGVPYLGHLLTSAPLPLSALSGVPVRRQEQRIKDEFEADAEVEDLKHQAEATRLALAGVARPQGLRAGLAVVVFLAIAGVLAPIWLMALRPVPGGPWVRFLVPAGLTAGIVGLAGYMLWSVARLLPGQQSAHGPHFNENQRQSTSDDG